MADPDQAPMLELRKVRKNLGGRMVLDGVDLRVKRGETLVIVGASGTGKSVTLKHMVALMHPDEGEVRVDGAVISEAGGRELAALRDRFGVLFQSGALLAWMSVFDNVALPLYEKTKLSQAEIAERVHRSLELVQLSGSEEKRPDQISGGMRKRAALARAVINEPDILLYDEPTSGLDPVMSRNVDELIGDMQARLGVTSVVVTHDLHSAFGIGDQVAMLHEGRVIAHAPPQEFVQSQIEYVQAFIRAQFAAGKVEGLRL